VGEVKHPVCYYLCNITAIDSNIEVPCDVDRNLKRRDMLQETAKFVVELLLNSAGTRSVQRHYDADKLATGDARTDTLERTWL